MIPNNRLVFYEPVQRLQNMAAFKVALDLWIYYVECELKGASNAILGRICVTDSYRTRDIDVRKMVDVLKLPRMVEDAIKIHVKSICAQVLGLSGYCRAQVFFRDLQVERSLSNFVWRPDGTIDYEKIIKRVIEGSELNERQRFALMCEYCMEDDIRKVWSELKDRLFFTNAQFESNPLTVYWSCVMVGDFSRMQVDDMATARNRVLESAYNINPNAVEYFFSQMSTDDRITYGVRLMKNKGAKMAKILMSKYTLEEQRRLFSIPNFFIKLIKIFAWPDCHFECAVDTWLHVRNLVDGGQFISMLQKIGDARLYSHRMHDLLVELWRRSPPSLKKFVYELPEDDQFLYWLCIRPPYSKTNSSFRQREDGILIAVLSDAESAFRKKLWRRYWTDIVDRSRPSSLKTILGLCLSNDELDELRTSIMRSDVIRQYFTELIAQGSYSNLNEFLEMFVCGERKERDEIRRQLLDNTTNLTYIVKKCEPTDGNVNALNNFLADVFGDDIRALIELKMKMVLACLTPAQLCVRYELVRIFCVSERLCDGPTLALVKEKILQRCKHLASHLEMRHCLQQVEWSMLLKWCLESEEKADQFNKSLLIG